MSSTRKLFVICFDVFDHRRLRKVSNEIENFGTRVQRSVFECHLNSQQILMLKSRLNKIIDKHEDKINYYSLCSKDQKRIQVDGGQYQPPDLEYHLQ